jgi:hypothetical protein
MASADAFVLVLRPRGQRPVYYMDRDEYNQYMVRASPKLQDACVYHNEGIAQGMREDLMHCGYSGYEVARVVEADGRAETLVERG